VDTLKIARSNFSFSSNKLDYLCKQLGIPMKHDTGFKLWLQSCGDGAIEDVSISETEDHIVKHTTYQKSVIEEALDKMYLYCKNDVSILVDVYLTLRAWDKRHPNIGLYTEDDEMVCHVCGSHEMKDARKQYYTSVSKFDVYRCKDCGAYTRKRQSHKRADTLGRGVAN
jgi:hypothetical protein